MRDADVRQALMADLNDQYQNDPNTCVVQEMGIWSGTARIDIAVINGELSGFELKSDRDTLDRLPYQSDIYSRVFDKITLVVGSKHIKKARPLIPKWWGIKVARNIQSGVSLTHVRKARPNPKADPYLIAQLLWKEEAIDALAKFDLAKGYRSKRVQIIHERLASELSLETLRHEVRWRLRSRQGWLVN